MKHFLLVAVTLLCLLQINYSQNNTAGLKKIQIDSFTMEYPLDRCCSFIQYHYGKNQYQNKIFFYNEGTSFTTSLNKPVYCNVATGTIKSIWEEDGVYTVFLEKDNFIIVLNNLKTINVKKGDYMKLGQEIGIVAADESNKNKGLLELLLFKGKKIVNPEKYLQKNKEAMMLFTKN